MPDFGRVSQIDASKYDAGTAYISVRRPLLNDRAPYIFKTADYGKTWKSITNGLPRDNLSYAKIIIEDPVRRGGQLHDPGVGAGVPAGAAHFVNEEATDLLGQLTELLGPQRAEVRG